MHRGLHFDCETSKFAKVWFVSSSSSFYPDHVAVKCPSITIMQHYYAPSHEISPVLGSLTRDGTSLEAGPAQGASLLQHHLIPPHLSDQRQYLGIGLMHDKRCKSTTGNQKMKIQYSPMTHCASTTQLCNARSLNISLSYQD